MRPRPFKKNDSAKTSWSGVSKWYDQLVGPLGSEYHREIIIPGALKLLCPRPGERILDLACGQGVFCRALAKLGVKVCGVDLSPELIRMARRHSQDDADYQVADARALDGMADQSFDASVCLLAIQNMDDLEKVVGELSRVTKTGGRLVWVLSHPCFRIPRQSRWGFDEESHIQYRRVDRYLSPMKIPIQMHPGSDPSSVTWSFHRSVSDYARALHAQGWAITQLEEWISHKKSEPGRRARAENHARREIPLFLALGAVKMKMGSKNREA